MNIFDNPDKLHLIFVTLHCRNIENVLTYNTVYNLLTS